MDIVRKSWVNHLIVAVGILIAGFIVLGFFKTIRIVSYLTANPEAPQCTQCITLNHNNTQRVVKSGIEMIVELPSKEYDPVNMIIVSDPAEIVEVYPAEAHVRKNWARRLNFIAPGTAEVLVENSREGGTDFRAVLTIQ
jgi:hypothetical protein